MAEQKKTKNKQTNKKRSVLWYKTLVSFMTSNKPTMTVKPSPTMTPRDHAIICVQLRSVICVAAKFICHAHMWPINITIRNKVAAGDDGPGLLPGRPHRAGTCQHRDRVCPRRSGGIIIKRDLTDDKVLLVLCAQVCVCACVCVCGLYCRNGQLSLIISISLTVHVLRFPFSSLMGVVCVCVCVCVHVCVHLHMCTLMWLTPSLAPLPLSTISDLVPLNSLRPSLPPISTVSIKQPIYFMTPVLQTFSRFTVIFMHYLVLECGGR